LRYLKAAFWSRPQIPLLKYFPWNAIAMAGAAVAGWFDPMIWLTAAGFETLYLATLATNPYFQRWVDAQSGIIDESVDRDALLRNLGGNARQRFVKLEEKVKKIEKTSESDDLLFESNRNALRKLSLLYLQLLAAQKELLLLKPADKDQIAAQIASLEAEMRSPDVTAHDTKQITLNTLTQRLRNMERREESLKEIDDDLARIEAQIDLALEEASLKNHPVSISGNVRLVSQMLDSNSDMTTTTSSEAQRQ
jgi:hypothetical protein